VGVGINIAANTLSSTHPYYKRLLHDLWLISGGGRRAG